MDPRRAALFVPPPLFYVLGFAVGVMMERVVPLARSVFAPGAGSQARIIVGGLLFAAGFVLGPLNAVRFLLARTTLNPAARPSQLVTHGWYRISRNPMYLGLFVLYCGIAVSNGVVWPFVTLVLPFLIIDRGVIPHEERMMAERFGADYEAYCGRVGRWVSL